MNLFFSTKMLPEILKMAVADQKAREQVQEIRKIAEERGISPKYIKTTEAK